MSELDKLEEYLKVQGINYIRIDQNEEKSKDYFQMDRHQIIVPEDGPAREWDAICQKCSYGYEQGLLEIMGTIVDEEKVGDTVEGYLTADDVIQRIEQLF